jgi:hypothetical protein
VVEREWGLILPYRLQTRQKKNHTLRDKEPIMFIAKLINRPNMGHQEVKFAHDTYVVHKWCEKWLTPAAKAKHREPMLCKIDSGPIRCELCGRRVGKELKKMVEKNSSAYRCKEFLDSSCAPAGKVKEISLTFYNFDRSDLREAGLKGYLLNNKLAEELL